MKFAFSPCPNDTFAFDACIHKKIPAAVTFEAALHDIDTLNTLALQAYYPITKVSAYCLGKLADKYALLSAGAAIGSNVGPKVVAAEPCAIEESVVAIPGKETTAHLLFQLLMPCAKQLLFLPYHEIVPAVLSGRCDAGVIIHETRFTFEKQGLVELYDLGTLFTEQTNAKIPLGVIVADKNLDSSLRQEVAQALKQSVAYAFANPQSSLGYTQLLSQEKDPAVIQQHIDLYVNSSTLALTVEDIASLETLFRLASKKQLLPDSALDILHAYENTDMLCH